MRNYLLIIFCFGLLMVWVLCGCNQTCKILSEPPGANVYLNGRLKGVTPYKLNVTASNHSRVPLSLSHGGYEILDTFLVKDGKTDKYLRILGYILVIPLDYDKKFKPEYTFLLKKKQGQFVPVNQEGEPESAPGKPTKIERLKKLQEEYKAGKISQEEFISKKKLILEGKD